jgi:hypothetical protein
MRRTFAAVFAITAMLSYGCAHRAVVEVPPRVDLREFETIGILEFESTSQGNLAKFATQRFIQSLQEAQPGVRVLELGKAGELEGLDRKDPLDYRAIKKIGDKYHVDAVVFGDLVVTEVRPRIDILHTITTMSVSADVDAALTARVLETGRGATLWTRSSNATRTVAEVGMSGKQVRFDAEHPDQAYGELVNCLVNDITYDFRPSYVRQ